MSLPVRSLDTMSDAIAMSSPNGRMSKRAQQAAQKHLSIALFGENGLQPEPVSEETKRADKKASCLRWAAFYRDLASKGMGPRKYVKEAEKMEAQAALLS